MDPLIARLHEMLVDAIERTRGGRLDQPVTVAEIYQDLIPYRSVRDPLALELNADYEHALLRLLSGEGDCVRLEPSEARRELAEELDSPNPFVGLYRKFAACDVWIRPSRLSSVLRIEEQDDLFGGAAEAFAAPEPVREAPLPRIAEPEPEPWAPEQLWEEEEAEPPPPAAAPAPRAELATAPRAGMAAPAADGDRDGHAAGAACAFCHEPLPHGRAVRFCPFCGEDQRRRPCRECGEVLEPEWRFCITCGAGIAEQKAPYGAA